MISPTLQLRVIEPLLPNKAASTGAGKHRPVLTTRAIDSRIRMRYVPAR
ncbi:hypothetical protein SAMN05192583_1885 [Sphingomonas gellani]|uniref:Uncharacterized protein n=1 Tax=Sphingomonas gellani TaxID=1166340 RepID=A0A1H8DD92_9SPHN|nr:hypothetical protein SAMN05192583_1885 [Sphingomonas gellani]